MTKDITIEIVVRKTYYAEVEDDFDFEDEAAMRDLAEKIEMDTDADTEDWEDVLLTDDETTEQYAL